MHIRVNTKRNSMGQKFIGALLVGAIVIFLRCGKEPAGPIITEYSDSYRVGDTWYCPLCNQPVKHGDRSQINPALILSEWHDVFLDSAYFESKINHISNQELFASLNLPGIFQGRDSLHAKSGASQVDVEQIKAYFSSRADNQRMYHYHQDVRTPFITISEFRHRVSRRSGWGAEIVRRGNAIVDPHRGYTIADQFFGWSVDWNYDWPNRSEFGVHYCRFFTDILNAYLISGEEYFVHAFADLFNQWYDQRDRVEHKMRPGEFKRRDVIWYELGLGNRIPRIIDCYRVFAGDLSSEVHLRILKTILGSARWLYQCLTRTPFHPYNWQIQSAVTLSYVGLLFPEFKEAKSWLQAGKKNMEQHFRHDLYEDGGYVERTGTYTEYVFGMFTRFVRMFQYFAGDTSYIDRVFPRLEKLMEFTALTTTPLGVNSPFNDCARGSYLADLLVEMGQFFHRGDFIGAVQDWIPRDRMRLLTVKPALPKTHSINFPDSRFVVMRDRWDRNGYFLILNYGPFQNHGHYDILDFEIFANGRPIAVDAGIGLHGYSDPLHVSWYKQSRAHNMLTVADAVVNKRDIAGEEIVWAPQSRTDYFAASHSGYQEYQQTRCRRHVAFVHGEYWVSLDQVETPHRHKQLDIHFHTPLHMQETAAGFISQEDPGAMILLAEEQREKTKFYIRSGPADLRGIPGEEPNREIDWLIFRRYTQADRTKDRFALLIYPFSSDSSSKSREIVSRVRFGKLWTSDTTLFSLKLVNGPVEDWLIFSDGQQHTIADSLSGDFTFAWLRWHGPLLQAINLVDVSRFNLPGKFSVRFDRKRNFEKMF